MTFHNRQMQAQPEYNGRTRYEKNLSENKRKVSVAAELKEQTNKHTNQARFEKFAFFALEFLFEVIFIGVHTLYHIICDEWELKRV